MSKYTKLLKLAEQIEKEKKRAEEVRDRLRKLYDEVDEIASSFENGIEELNCAITNLRIAVDSMSEQV